MSNESPIVSFRVPLSGIKELIAKGRLTEEYTKSELSNLIKEDWLKSQAIDFDVPVPNSVLEEVLAKLNKIEAEGSLWRSAARRRCTQKVESSEKGEDLTKHERNQMVRQLASQKQIIDNYKRKIAKLEEKLANQKQSAEAFDEDKFEEAIIELEAALKLEVKEAIKTRIVDFFKSISTWSSFEYNDLQ